MTHVRFIPAFTVVPDCSGAIEWLFPPDAELQITTLAAWRQIRQLQREPLPSTEHEEDDLNELNDNEECTGLLESSSLDGDAGVKDVLDRLAELLCYRKDPSLITSTAILYNDEEVTIVAARNSSANGEIWSDKDVKMLEYLAAFLQRVSSDDIVDSDPLPALQNTLVEYYSQSIRHHAKEVMSIEQGKTRLRSFISNDEFDGAASLPHDVFQFASYVEHLSYDTDFYAELKANLTPQALRRVIEGLGFIRRPIQGAAAFVRTAQQYPGFCNIKFVLLDSLPPKNVEVRHVSGVEFPVAPRLAAKFGNLVKKVKHVHAEMRLMTYLISSIHGTNIFPYLGISKKTCLLCGHLLRHMGQFETRGNHGKCYSQWTLPSSLWVNTEDAGKLCKAVQYLRDTLQNMEEASHRDAEKESMVAAPVPPPYGRTSTLINRVVEDPRFLVREAEWFTLHRKRDSEANSPSDSVNKLVNSEAARDSANIPIYNTGVPKKEDATPTACAFCKNSEKLAHSCKKCGVGYCDPDCYFSDWYRHKFSCNLGRSTDPTDYLVLSCHTNQFPQEDDVLRQYGFMYFASGNCRSRLFELYRRLIINWNINETELRNAVEQNQLKEMLTFRCRQTGDPAMLSYMKWLQNEEGFGANGQGPGIMAQFDAARKELLSNEDRKLPPIALQPPEKLQALIFYTQIRNGFKPDVDEDNWISLGFCTAVNLESEQRIAAAYGRLIARCSFDEFWNAMTESRIVGLFSKYGLGDRISYMRNFTIFMAMVSRWHQSVWELKRFTRMGVVDPFRAVVVDYGFMQCEDASHRMRLREIYREYFERGADEIRLHEACVSGKLAIFLESILGSLKVPPDLFSNPYPLENYPLAGMVTGNVVVCPESALGHIKALENSTTEKAEVVTIPDTEDAAMRRCIHEKAAFVGTGLRKRYYSGSNGTVIEELQLL